MISVVNGEPLPEPDTRWEHHGGLGNLLPLLLVVVFVASGVLRAMFGRLFGSMATGGLVGGIAWLLSHLLAIGFGAGIIGFLFAMLLGSTRSWSTGGGGWGGGLGGLGGRFWWARRLRRRRRWRLQRRRRRFRRRRRLGKLVMQIGRLIRHLAATHWRTRMLFPASTLDAIEAGDSPGREGARRRDTLCRRNVADAAAYSRRGGASRPRARGVRAIAMSGIPNTTMACWYMCRWPIAALKSLPIAASGTASARPNGRRCAG